ncbi:MAG: hypothetical protein ACOYB2_10430 [Limnohabitans sp.]
MVVRKMVTETLGSSGPPQRVGSLDRPVSAEELALTGAHDAARVVWLMYKATAHTLTVFEEAELGITLDRLYVAWEEIDAWKPGDDRVPVIGEPGDARVDWEG